MNKNILNDCFLRAKEEFDFVKAEKIFKFLGVRWKEKSPSKKDMIDMVDALYRECLVDNEGSNSSQLLSCSGGGGFEVEINPDEVRIKLVVVESVVYFE